MDTCVLVESAMDNDGQRWTVWPISVLMMDRRLDKVFTHTTEQKEAAFIYIPKESVCVVIHKHTDQYNPPQRYWLAE